jgi:hypothetical protein
MAKNSEQRTEQKVQLPPAEFKYIGDDGGRWIFERRSDKLVITIDKPAGITLDTKTPPISLRLTCRGKKLNEDVLAMVRR